MITDKVRARRGRPTYVQNLEVGAVIIEEDGTWVVTREPEIRRKTVKVYVAKPKPGKRLRSQAFLYPKDSHIKLATV